jgi:hypothetical protein
MPPGSLQGLVLAVDDVRATYEELLAKGVSFDFPPREMPEGFKRCSATPTATASSSQVGE